MQGGRFDHADRLLHSLPDAWNQVLTNSSDVKEMIPEFFYCAAALRNSEGLQLGMRQDGSLVGDVALPPWANGSADEFIRIHRCALSLCESLLFQGELLWVFWVTIPNTFAYARTSAQWGMFAIVSHELIMLSA